MTNETMTTERTHCPSCQSTTKRVSTVTLGALLREEYAKPFKKDARSCRSAKSGACTAIDTETGWRFCDSTDCDVVYVSEDGDATFTKSQLKVEVGVKETAGERPLCYCFRHSVGSIKEELRKKGRSDAFEDIRARMKALGCHCESSNPSGSCCLGVVAKGIGIAGEELAENESPTRQPSLDAPSVTGDRVKFATIGTIISAVVASSCCWLPLVLLVVGVSGAGVASTLETYRPVFITMTLGFIAAAFYFTYRPKRCVTSDGESCCATEPAGENRSVPDKQRVGMGAANKIILWGTAGMAITVLFFPSYVGSILGNNDAVVTEDMTQVSVKIEGMTCEGCSTIAARAIREIPGVEAVEVSYKKKQATVGVGPGTASPTGQILSALQRVGYQGELLPDRKTQAYGEGDGSFNEVVLPQVFDVSR